MSPAKKDRKNQSEVGINVRADGSLRMGAAGFAAAIADALHREFGGNGSAIKAMTSPVEAMPSDEPGVYLFRTNLTMAGGWRFSIAAKVQGEPATIESRLVFRAVE